MKKIVYLIFALLLLGACARKNESGREAQENYGKALEDSIRSISMEIDSCNEVAESLSDKIGNLLPEFRAVNNAREVEGYMIFQGWENKYPLKSTGLVARLSDSRELELVAALSGGVFDQIRVTGPAVVASSDVVPNDQALNYRQEGLTTVMFSGEAADSVAKLIADNELNPLTVTFMNGGKTTGSCKLDNENAKMITMTYIFYSANREQAILKHRSLKLGEKLKLLRQHKEKSEQK